MTIDEKRRTKIVCTIGPSSSSPEVMRKLLDAGMNVARLNMSHGDHDHHRATYDRLRSTANEAGRNLGIMIDLQGPKIRTGLLVDRAPVHLEVGKDFCITTRDRVGTEECVSTSYTALPTDVKAGDSIFMADGILELRVERVQDQDVHCTVIHGGFLGEHKGINLPGINVSSPALTEKDIVDLKFALTLDIDFIALSFVRTASEVKNLKKRIKAAGKRISVIAKIERPEAITNFTEIVDAADAIMLARGDLGVEVPMNEVPQIQKDLISRCNDVGVPVITATQMLESMISSARPTRAEVADVANAIYDGTDAVMLSGETASGQFPVRAVEVMASVARDADAAQSKNPSYVRIQRMRESGIRQGRGSYGDAVAQAACRTAHALGATRILCFTRMGYTAALIARYRPSVPITAVIMTPEICQRCAVVWGVDTLLHVDRPSMPTIDSFVDDIVFNNNLAEPGDTVILAGAVPFGKVTRTNMMKLHTVGNRK